MAREDAPIMILLTGIAVIIVAMVIRNAAHGAYDKNSAPSSPVTASVTETNTDSVNNMSDEEILEKVNTLQTEIDELKTYLKEKSA